MVSARSRQVGCAPSSGGLMINETPDAAFLLHDLRMTSASVSSLTRRKPTRRLRVGEEEIKVP